MTDASESNGFDFRSTSNTRSGQKRRIIRWMLLLGTLLCAVGLTFAYVKVVEFQGINAAEFVALGIFVVLALWISFPFCSCLLGFWSLTFRGRSPVADRRTEPLPRTAVLVPIYNESPTAVFSAVLAMARSLEKTRKHRSFEFFVLSDTQRPDIWRQEEFAWAKTSAAMPADIPVYYRRRPKNVARKSGNIADFVSQWGGRYELMVVLDADSVMEGTTLVEMTARAAADSAIGILQVPPKPVDRRSLLARVQQFSAEVYGPIFQRGYTFWTGSDGNYFGHNAVIRTASFAKHCTLPVLPGEPPLGGHILSHDFVEAALMRRAGHKVVTADDLGGSYEECPTTLLDYAIRDQRWCQGNLQHGRLLALDGWPIVNRFHFLTGVLSYVSSVLWIMFMAAMAAGAYLERGSSGQYASTSAATLFGIVFVMLLMPKFLALLSLASNRGRVTTLGGWTKIALGVLLETLLTVLLSPILAFYHATFVISTVIFGRSVQWNAQARDERVIPFRELLKLHKWQTITGILIMATSFSISTATGLWSLPISIGLCLSIPIAYLLGNPALGDWLKHRGVLTIPEEVVRPDVLRERDRAFEELTRGLARPCQRKLLSGLLLDPAMPSLQAAGLMTETFTTDT